MAPMSWNVDVEDSKAVLPVTVSVFGSYPPRILIGAPGAPDTSKRLNSGFSGNKRLSCNIPLTPFEYTGYGNDSTFGLNTPRLPQQAAVLVNNVWVPEVPAFAVMSPRISAVVLPELSILKFLIEFQVAPSWSPSRNSVSLPI